MSTDPVLVLDPEFQLVTLTCLPLERNLKVEIIIYRDGSTGCYLALPEDAEDDAIAETDGFGDAVVNEMAAIKLGGSAGFQATAEQLMEATVRTLAVSISMNPLGDQPKKTGDRVRRSLRAEMLALVDQVLDNVLVEHHQLYAAYPGVESDPSFVDCDPPLGPIILRHHGQPGT